MVVPERPRDSTSSRDCGTWHTLAHVFHSINTRASPDVAIRFTWSHEPTDASGAPLRDVPGPADGRAAISKKTASATVHRPPAVVAGSFIPSIASVTRTLTAAAQTRVLPTTSLGRYAHTNAPHEGCTPTRRSPGRTRRFRPHSQHRTQTAFTARRYRSRQGGTGSEAQKQPY